MLAQFELPFRISAHATLWQALTTTGGFVIRNALPISLAWEAQEVGKAWFNYPELLKVHPYCHGTRIGYTAPGVERTVRSAPTLIRHAFDYRPGTCGIVGSIIMDPFYWELERVAFRVLEGIGADAQAVLEAVRGGPHVLRTARYLNTVVETDQMLFPEHIDFGVFTLFIGGSTQGLEVKREGEWVPITLPLGDVLIGAGSLLKQYCPEVVPMRHRVMGTSAQRTALFFFLEPRHDVVLPNGEVAGQFLNRVLSSVRNDGA
ncbi:MAG: 2OG-Fe(II) oxygenase family protein [Patescibacteria group bacterium]